MNGAQICSGDRGGFCLFLNPVFLPLILVKLCFLFVCGGMEGWVLRFCGRMRVAGGGGG